MEHLLYPPSTIALIEKTSRAYGFPRKPIRTFVKCIPPNARAIELLSQDALSYPKPHPYPFYLLSREYRTQQRCQR